jgi:uncharacterized membrane protein
MFTLPTPLHPVIVHFPIVLILVGAPVAVISIVVNRWHLPVLAAVLLALGSIGSFVASQTGEAAEELAGALAPAADTLLEAHEESAERAEVAGAIAALLAIAAASLGALALRRRATDDVRSSAGPLPKLALGLRIATALASLMACYFIFETGHAGGKLVYEHGVGVKTTATQQGQPVTRARVDRD